MNFKNGILAVLVSVFFIITLTNISEAQEHINFKHITIENGLSQSNAQTIYQDSNGYIWIGTNEGLNRYNGFEMKVYKADKDKKNTIINNYILSIQEDNEKNLWVGTNKGISKINLETEEITNYEHDEDGNTFFKVRSILLTKRGTVLVITQDNVYMYDREFDKFKVSLSEEDVFSKEDVMDIEEDNFHNIWIGTDKSLIKMDRGTMKITQYISHENVETLKDDRINSILIDDENNLWVSTNNNGLIKILVKNGETHKVIRYYHDANDDTTIPSNTTKSIIQDENGMIWIGTDSGLCKYLGDNKFYTYHNNYDSNSLLDDNVYSLMQDSTGLIWVGTYTGISIFNPNNKIIQYKSDPLNKNSLSSNVIQGVYEDEDGLIWVGTRDKGLNIMDRENNKYIKISAGEGTYDITSNLIRVIQGSGDTVWVGTDYGLNQINRKTMKVKKYTMNNGLTSDMIESLLIDSRGYLWIGTQDGISILDIKTEKIVTVDKMIDTLNKTIKEKVGDTHIQEIFEDKDGVYWLGTYTAGSMIKIDVNQDKIKVFKLFDHETKEEINTIKCIAEGNDNILWIGTSDGLVKFYKSNGTSIKYTDEDGLSNNTVYGVLIDDDGNPWASTNKGISKFDLKTNEFRNLSTAEGLQSNEFNDKSEYKTKDGEFIFGGIKGLNIFNPADEEAMFSYYEPTITFESFMVDGEKYKNIDNLQFKYDQNDLKISYFIPQYRNNNLKFYYKLEGVMDEWTSTSNNQVLFNKLDPGKYTFKIKARNQKGVMGEEYKVTFTIKPPLWKSKGAIISYIVMIIMLVCYNSTKVKRLDNLVAVRTEALSNEMETNKQLFDKIIEVERNKNNYFINLSHELRTPLNVISSVEQLITNLNKSPKGISREKIDEYMVVMNKNIKRLLNLINNIIDTTKIENGKYKINIQEEDIVYIVEESALSLKDAIESMGLNLIIDTNTEEKIIKCDRNEIERCIINLLSNASKFTPVGGDIKVDILDLGDKVKIIVEDTGIGIEEKYHAAIFDRFNQIVDEHTEVKGGSGLGLTITKHIIDMHNGEIYVESEVNKGTKFTIILPVDDSIDENIII